MEDEDKEIPEPKETAELSDYDKALALVKRREEVTKVEMEVLAEKKKLATNELLSSSAGARVEAPKVSEAEKKQKGAEEFFKDTALGDAIKKANE